MQIIDDGRSKVKTSLTPQTAKLALQRILPYPCKKQYTAVILMPQTSHFKLLKSFFRSTQTSYRTDAKVSHDYARFSTYVYIVHMSTMCHHSLKVLEYYLKVLKHFQYVYC